MPGTLYCNIVVVVIKLIRLELVLNILYKYNEKKKMRERAKRSQCIEAREQKDSVAPCFLFPTDAYGSAALEEILVL